MVIGILMAPKITKGLKRMESLGVIAEISFGLALLLAGLSEMAGLAMIIGAYITGLAFSQTDVASEMAERVKAVGEYFVPVFFAVMGMMVDFKAVGSVLVFGILFSVMAFIGKLIGCGVPALFVGFNVKGAFRIGAGMLPRGEVTLIVAGIGLASGAIGADMFGVAVMTMLLASIAAPPLLVASFKGGPGYRHLDAEAKKVDMVTIELEFPNERIARFVRRSLSDGFRQEGFFVTTVEGAARSWQIRKEETIFFMRRIGANMEITVKEEDEAFVRLMAMEVLVDFQEFANSLLSMEKADMMGANLLIQMFSEENEL
jgi:Kef-type K+ transport system membrane component KefB